MWNRIRYSGLLTIAIPLIPFLILQGRKVRREVPRLPGAKTPYGTCHGSKNERRHIIFIGESTIAGLGVEEHQNGIAGAVSQHLSDLSGFTIDWTVHAQSGYTAKMVTDRLLPKIKKQDPDIIIIGLGGNDAFTFNTPWKWKKQIETLINRIRLQFPETTIAFINMPPIKDFPAFTPLIKWIIGNLVEILGQELNVISKKYENFFYDPKIIELEDWLGKFDHRYKVDDFFSDGVHPSMLTYKQWGKDFADFLFRLNVLQN
ncbi:SGNH/GDSL hydrolase family protein [Portibacter marinus]|uniref:SGNH/GDSL hydrolase family protein n=1 Tax=Portibacter marinus TaxID=2898660 RepID=UPI001F1D235C|nr:SGNH/GDSL hydrolase family protein [Portibacter marinus]